VTDYALAEAFVQIRPDTTGFKAETESKVKAALAGLKPEVPVKLVPDIAGFQTLLKAALAKSLGSAGGVTVPVGLKFDIDEGSLARQIALLKAKMAQLGLVDFLDYDLPLGKIQYQISLLRRLLQQGKLTDFLGVSLNDAQALQASVKLREAVQRELGNVDIGIGLDPADVAAEAAAIKAAAKAALGGEVIPVTEVVTGAAGAGGGGGGKPPVTVPAPVPEPEGGGGAGELGAQAAAASADAAALLKLAAASKTAGDAAKYAYAANVAQNIALSQSEQMAVPVADAVNRLAGRWGALSNQITLFGGAFDKVLPFLASVALWHVLADSIIEVGATLIPAAIAFTAFGVGAIDTVDEIYAHIKNLDMANDELGGTIYPLTGGFTRLAAAVQPEVYTLFGEGLVLVAHNANAFTEVATAAGKVVDDLGARFVYAQDTGHGLGIVLKNSVADLAGWGDLIGNVGGILGNFFKAMPGYAQILLGLADGITHVIETVTGAIVPVINLGLALHGAILYIGLAATAGAFLVSGVFTQIGRLALFAAVGLDGLGAAGGVAATGLLEVGAAAETAATLPWGWIMTAVAGLILLTIEFSKTKDAATAFSDSMQSLVQNAKLMDLMMTLNSAIEQSSVAVAVSMTKVDLAQQALTRDTSGSVGALKAQQSALISASTAHREYSQGLSQLQAEQQLVNSRVATLGKTYGGTTAALSLLNAAGITSAQITDKNNQHWQTALIEIEAQHDALIALTGDTGRYEAALNALSGPEQYLGDMLKSIQNIATAQDALIANLVQGQTALDTFEGGFQTLAQNLATATGRTVGFSSNLDDLRDHAKQVGQALGGTSQAAYALNSAFYSEVPNAQKIIDALEEQEATTKQLTTATATISKQMLAYAGNNVTARATIVAMINDALGPGTVSLQSLNTWVNRNSTSMSGLNAIIDMATIKAGQLSNVLANNLNVQFHNDLLAASGADGALKTYTADLVHNQQNTAAGHSDRQALINDLIAAGDSAKQATNYVNGLSKALPGLNKSETTTLRLQGVGEISLRGSGAYIQGESGHIQAYATGTRGAAAGWGVVGENGPELVKFSGGEHVLPVVPGYAGGTPGADQAWMADTASTMQGTFAKDAATAFANAFAKAMTGVIAGGSASPGVVTVARYIMSRGGTKEAGAGVGGVVAGESGGNPEILQAGGGGGAGILQWTPASSAFPLQPIITGNVGRDMAVQLVDMMAYIQSRGGLASINAGGRQGGPLGAARVFSAMEAPLVPGSDIDAAVVNSLYARGFDSGGWLMPGATVAINNTRKPELVSKPDQLDNMVQVLKQQNYHLRQLCTMVCGLPVPVGQAVASAMNGVSSRAVTSALYPNRNGSSR
jgi:Phage tail lysozyme